VNARDFDPEGDDGSENPDAAGNASDGNPSTAWSTETYQAPSQEFGNSKSGVGLILELDGQHEVSAVSVAADDSDWNADVYVSDQSGNDLPAWGQARASKEGLGRDALFAIDPNASGRFVLLWLTRLPSDGKLGINEVAIAGR
jgi:putative peptidoglycan lipid II flippase